MMPGPAPMPEPARRALADQAEAQHAEADALWAAVFSAETRAGCALGVAALALAVAVIALLVLALAG